MRPFDPREFDIAEPATPTPNTAAAQMAAYEEMQDVEPLQDSSLEKTEQDAEIELSPSVPTIPAKPSADEVTAHEATHANFAPWCESCISGRGKEKQHRRVLEDRGEHVIKMDFQYYSREGNLVPDHARLATVLTAVDSTSGWPLSIYVPHKKPDEYMFNTLALWIAKLGHKQFVIHTDGEPTIKKIAQRLQSKFGIDKCQLRTSPRRSSASLGDGEQINGYLAGLVRTWLHTLNEKYPEAKVDASHYLFPWVVKYVSWVTARFHEKNGITPYKLITGRDYRGDIIPFGDSAFAEDLS